jgi:hypothetical protein
MLFISMNTICLTSGIWLGVAILSFAISFIWCVNVKRIAVHTITERVIYAGGAMCGALVGLLITKIFI